MAYVLEEMLGEGSYGRVYRARACADGRQVVAKALKTGTDSLKHALAEAVALDRCRGHPRVPHLAGCLHARQPRPAPLGP